MKLFRTTSPVTVTINRKTETIPAGKSVRYIGDMIDLALVETLDSGKVFPVKWDQIEELPPTAPDAHLESAFEDRVSGFED